jgi:hypothetical protein
MVFAILIYRSPPFNFVTLLSALSVPSSNLVRAAIMQVVGIEMPRGGELGELVDAINGRKLLLRNERHKFHDHSEGRM